MSKLAAAIAANRKTDSTGCRVGSLLASLPKAEAADLVAALAEDVRITSAPAIVAGLLTLGHEISKSTITVHRGGGCRCAK